jgi:ribosomal protein S18 acetylase RimI-like enzyme
MHGVTSADLDAAPAEPSETIVEATLFAQLERFYDAVPRSAARTEDFGSLTLFVREGAGFPYYARPAQTWTGAFTVDDVVRVRARQRKLGIPESIEWIAEATPGLRAAVEASGLPVHGHPLMVLDPDVPLPPFGPLPDGVEVRVLGPADPALTAALMVPQFAFAEPGTGVGRAGAAELAAAIAARAEDGMVEQTRERIRAGLTVMATAVENGVTLCAGRHLPVGDTSEIAAVGTLPAARRRGLGLAVTAALAADARARGVRTILLSASDEAVARIYARLGFRRVGTALIAEY